MREQGEIEFIQSQSAAQSHPQDSMNHPDDSHTFKYLSKDLKEEKRKVGRPNSGSTSCLILTGLIRRSIGSC